MTLYHYTCSHAEQAIRNLGYVLPLATLRPETSVLGWGIFAWFTDLDTPDRSGLGLTSTLLSCDRTEHRFEVSDSAEVEQWVTVRRYHPWAEELESAPGALPIHWWVATEPVPVEVKQ